MSLREIARARSRSGPAPGGAVLAVGRDLLFLSALGLYIVILGQNWGVYASAAMIAAYRSAFRGAGIVPAVSNSGTRRRRAPRSARLPANGVRHRAGTGAGLSRPARSGTGGAARAHHGRSHGA